MSGAREQLEADHFRTVVSRDISRLAVGELLGRGQYREVFEWLPNKALVLKVENGAKCFSNVLEHEVWERIKGTEHAKWFAPVVDISDTGAVLLQTRTQPVLARELPTHVPAFFTDLKPANWGRLGKRIVCHDYGVHLMLEVGMTKRMRKADWGTA